MTSLGCAGCEHIQGIDAYELVGICELGGVEIGAGDEVGGEDGDCSQHLKHNQQHPEVDVLEVEAFHPEEVKRYAEVHQSCYRNREDLDQKNEGPEYEVKG